MLQAITLHRLHRGAVSHDSIPATQISPLVPVPRPAAPSSAIPESLRMGWPPFTNAGQATPASQDIWPQDAQPASLPYEEQTLVQPHFEYQQLPAATAIQSVQQPIVQQIQQQQQAAAQLQVTMPTCTHEQQQPAPWLVGQQQLDNQQHAVAATPTVSAGVALPTAMAAATEPQQNVTATQNQAAAAAAAEAAATAAAATASVASESATVAAQQQVVSDQNQAVTAGVQYALHQTLQQQLHSTPAQQQVASAPVHEQQILLQQHQMHQQLGHVQQVTPVQHIANAQTQAATAEQ